MTTDNLKKLVKESKHFCILPWIHFHAWPNGKVMPCCVADSNQSVSQIKPKQSIIKMMNSAEFKQMRLDMLNDKPVKACNRCYELEKIGVWTLRQSQNIVRGLNSIDLVSKTTDDGSIKDFKMKYMDIRFSNLCNMKCRTCGPECSSLHAQEFVEKRKGSEALKNYFKMESTLVSVNETGEFFKKLTPYLDDVEEVYFAGGESLLTKEHYDCLEYWIKKGLTEKVELTYTTNFSSLKYKNKNLVSLWKQFPKVKIWASLDDSGPRAELLRKGTDWNKIEENILKIKNDAPHIQFSITPTISIWNVFSFPKFFDSMIERKLISEELPPRLNLLTHPWWANIQILPDDVKEKLIKVYDTYVEKYSYDVHMRNRFKIVRNSLKEGSANWGERVSRENKDGIKEFIAFNEEMDSIRNEKILKVIPELKEIYKWAKS